MRRDSYAHDEKRRIASALRAQQADQFPDPEVAYDVSPSLTTWESIGRIVLDPETWAECDRLRSRDNRTQAVRSIIAGRLADLIEPSCDREALLALADEIEGTDCVMRCCNDASAGIIFVALDHERIARRIREACGEVD